LIVFDQLQYIRNKDLGFDKSHVRLELNERVTRERRRILEKLKQYPEVAGAGWQTPALVAVLEGSYKSK
jgi:hypothetical protein